MKYSCKIKIECVNKYKNDEYITHLGTPNQQGSFMKHVRIWTKTYNMLGINGINILKK